MTDEKTGSAADTVAGERTVTGAPFGSTEW